jgi:hypothetical protein
VTKQEMNEYVEGLKNQISIDRYVERRFTAADASGGLPSFVRLDPDASVGLAEHGLAPEQRTRMNDVDLVPLDQVFARRSMLSSAAAAVRARLHGLQERLKLDDGRVGFLQARLAVLLSFRLLLLGICESGRRGNDAAAWPASAASVTVRAVGCLPSIIRVDTGIRVLWAGLALQFPPNWITGGSGRQQTPYR